MELGEVKHTPRGYSCSFKASPIFSVSISGKFLNNLEAVFNALSSIFDDYFSTDEEKQIDRFLESKGHIVRNKHSKIEKKRQQQLYRNNKETKDGYFFYDMEFQQKHNSIDDLKEDIEAEINNKPDMQAIKFKNGEAKSLVFVEVKCTKSAYAGDSGLDVHFKKMENYPKERLESRRREAYLMLYQYSELGLLKLDKPIDGEEFEKLPYEGLLLFTDEAIDLWNSDTRYEEERKNNINKEVFDKVENEKIKMVLCKIG